MTLWWITIRVRLIVFLLKVFLRKSPISVYSKNTINDFTTL